MTMALRWDYESPITERFGRLVNLDVAPDFSAVAPVIATDGTGPVTGSEVAKSLAPPDKHGFQPRLGIAWRPVPGSSLVVRAAYGVYRNSNIYQSIATRPAHQPPLSTSFRIDNSLEAPLTLADGFIVGRTLGLANALNTF